MAAQPAASAPLPTPEARPLAVARQPARARRSITDIGTLLALALFVACLAPAALHAVLVENQASLDDLVERNQRNIALIDQLQARVAVLDSPEGLAEQAAAAGLVPAVDLVAITPIAAGLLAPPGDDPFGLIAAGPASEVGTSPDAAR